jgi:hypothetical protein
MCEYVPKIIKAQRKHNNIPYIHEDAHKNQIITVIKYGTRRSTREQP